MACEHTCDAHVREGDDAVYVRVNRDFHPAGMIVDVDAMLSPLDVDDRRRIVAWLADEYLTEGGDT